VFELYENAENEVRRLKIAIKEHEILVEKLTDGSIAAIWDWRPEPDEVPAELSDVILGISANVYNWGRHRKNADGEPEYYVESLVNMFIPWNIELVDFILGGLIDDGWEIAEDTNSGPSDSPWRRFELNYLNAPDDIKVNFTMTMSPTHFGSTCELVQVDTEIVEKPIYQVKCENIEE